MSLEIVDLDESSAEENPKEFESPKRKLNNLPYLRKDFIQLIKPMQEKISVQQRQIDQGNEQIRLLLHQMGAVLQERTLLFQRVAEIREFFNDRQNKRSKINMTKKEIKANLDKCDNILETTINQKDLIKADVLNNMALCAQQKNELTKVENEYQTLSSVVSNSVNYSVKEKIVELNLRLENFHVLTDEDFREKLNLMEIERNNLMTKLMEREKQEEKAKRLYKEQLKLQKDEEHQAQIEETQKDRDVDLDNQNPKSKNKLKSTERNIKKGIRDVRRTRIVKPSYNEDNDEYSDYDENFKERPKRQPRKIKKQPHTTKERTRIKKHSNKNDFNADSEDSYNNEDDDHIPLPRKRINRDQRKAKSPKPKNLKKILDEEKEYDEPSPKNRSRSVTTKKKQKLDYDYDEDEKESRTSKTKKRSNQSSTQKKAKKTSQTSAKKKNTTKRKKE